VKFNPRTLMLQGVVNVAYRGSDVQSVFSEHVFIPLNHNKYITCGVQIVIGGEKGRSRGCIGYTK
jgi:hypothetical protein